MLATLDPLGQLDLLGGGEQRDAADVLEEQLQRVGGDLGLGLDLRLGLFLLRVDDLDLRLVERRVELVHLAGVEVELVERERDLLRVEPARAAPGLEEGARFVRFEHALGGGWGATGFLGFQVDPLRHLRASTLAAGFDCRQKVGKRCFVSICLVDAPATGRFLRADPLASSNP